MARSKKSRTSAATRALRAAIAEETAELTAQIKEKDVEISRLHGVLRQIGGIVGGVGAPPLVPAPRLRAPEPDPIPDGPSVPLAEEDGMGEGRWA